MRSLLLAAALLSQLPADAPALEAPATPQVVVVEHASDAALRDRLVRVMDVWHDAGDFLVGAADVRLLEGLAERGVEGRALPEVLESDDWRTRVGRCPLVRNLAFLGQRAIIGTRWPPSQAPNLKPSRSPLSRWPLATESCILTRSTPVVASVTGCSTCRRVFISMK